MGRVVKGADYYISDRGIREKLSEMDVSHLINAIAHHQKQLGVLESLHGTEYNTEFVITKRLAIGGVVEKLKKELSIRKEDDNKEYDINSFY